MGFADRPRCHGHGFPYYNDAFRNLLLRLKRHSDVRRLSALIVYQRATLPMPHPAIIVLIPSWKGRQATPLPGLIAKTLGQI